MLINASIKKEENEMIKRKTEIMTIGEAYTMYMLEKKAKGCVPQTIENSQFVLKLFLDDNELSETDALYLIDKERFVSWTNFMMMKDLSPESINAYLSRMRGFVNWCISYEYLPYFKVTLIKHQEEKIKFFNDEELKILTKKPAKDCDFIEYRTWTIICFILATGARAGTICNIKIKDVDFNCKQVTYTHLKNKKLANIPLSNNLCKILIDYLRVWDTNSEYLFCDRSGNQLTTSAIRQALIKYCKRRNVEPRGPHALRHSFARGWIRNGGGSFQLQQMLTHKDITMTRRYVSLFSTDLEQDVSNYNPLDSIRREVDRTHRVVRR